MNHEVIIQGNNVGCCEINNCIEKYKEIKAGNYLSCDLQIIAENEITDFDFSLIGHFILFIEECSNLSSITINLRKNMATDTTTSSIVWKLKQQMIHAYYSTGKDIFTLIDGNGELSKASLDKEKITGHSVLSKKFLPITYLNKYNYKTLFEDKMNFIPLVNLDLKDKDEDGLYKACRRFLFKQVTEKNYIKILSQLAFYHALMDVKILRYYLYAELEDITKEKLGNNKDNFQVGTTKNSLEKKEYWNDLMPIFNELKETSTFSILLFFTFVSSDLIESKKELNEQATIIKNLWKFTKELVYGINELAKNVIEHSDNKKGIITGFVNDKNEFELSIFDYGENGIIETFKNHLSQRVNNENVQQDITAIESGDFKFSSFFDLENGYMLNEQANRATAHLGLLFTYQLIKKNNEVCEITVPFKVVSPSRKQGMDAFPDDSIKSELPDIGTFYKITLSLKDREYKPYKRPVLPKTEKFSTSTTFKEDDLCVIIPLKKENLFGYTDTDTLKNSNNVMPKQREFDLWLDIQQKMRSYSQKKWVCIDFLSVWEEKNTSAASELFRFLGKFELYYPTVQLIVLNIKTNVLAELNQINKYYVSATNVDYWNKDKATLIYSYDEINENRFYFTDILWGKEKIDFDKINAYISKYHFNRHSLDPSNDLDEQQDFKLPELNTLFEDNALIPFDRYITDEERNKPLLKFNPETLLEIAIESDGNINVISSAAIKEYLSQLVMHKIEKSHFRLGSRIHITDFYYAKPFFQNSYFAQRLALSLAYDIIKDKQLDNKKELTLIGYGLYSELLVCYVKEFLENHYNERIKINTNTVTDSEECKLNKAETKANPIYDNVIIIVPIATTFSTSIKIRNMLKEKDSLKNVIEPYYNIFVVVDEIFPKEPLIFDLANDKKYVIFKAFGWKEIDTKNKIVKTEVFDSNPTEYVSQRYYAHQPTSWHEVACCKVCFPDDECNNEDKRNCLYCKINCATKEIPLFVTDKTSLTPELILGWPMARFIEKTENNRLILTKTTIKCGHIKRGNNHYRYYFNNDELWNENKNNVKEWLKKVKGEIEVENTDRIVMLAPCHFSNVDFVEMVNKIVFDNRATIIHYDPNIENPQNFENFYGSTIGIKNKKFETEDTKLYFVDDVLTSGSTFFNANTFLRHISTSVGEPQKEFEKCFFFINRAGYFEYGDIINLLGENKILSFSNLHFPYIKQINYQCPLCTEEKKYDKLYENSYLTRIKLHFLEEQKKLKITEIHAEEDSTNEERAKRILRRVEAIHRIYNLFSERHSKEFKQEIQNSFKIYFDESSERYLNIMNFREWVNFLIKKSINPFKESYLIENEPKYNNDDLLSETEKSVLKCLTQSSFCDYKKIREATFYWVIALLDEKIEHIKGNNKVESLNELKLLIRRATLLSSNYITSYKMLSFLLSLYSKKELEGKLPDFSVFFVAQVNELLYRDSSCSEQFDKRFKYFEQQASSNNLFRQLIRMLREENAAKTRVLVEELDKKGIYTEIGINRYLISHNLTHSISIKKFLKVNLEIKHILSNQDEIEVSKIKDNIENWSKFIQTPQGGCFVIVKYKNSGENPYYLLHNKGDGKSDIILKENDYLGEDKPLIKFLDKGESFSENNEYPISIIELHKNDNGIWKDLFSNKDVYEHKMITIPQNSNRLLLLRIDRDTISDKDNTIKYNGQAVIGFYFKADNYTLTDIEQIRYLLLLRSDISKYIKKVVEKNDAFKDWVEERKFLNAPDHNYYNALSELKNCRADDEKFDFLYALLISKKEIDEMLKTKELKSKSKYMQSFDVKKKIENYCSMMFENEMPNITGDFGSIRFHEAFFRHIMYEYLYNARKAKTKDIVIVISHNSNEEYSISIENKHECMENDNILFKYRKQLSEKGYYDSSKIKGLYLNYLLLDLIGSTPKVYINKSDDEKTAIFKINFTIRSM